MTSVYFLDVNRATTRVLSLEHNNKSCNSISAMTSSNDVTNPQHVRVTNEKLREEINNLQLQLDEQRLIQRNIRQQCSVKLKAQREKDTRCRDLNIQEVRNRLHQDKERALQEQKEKLSKDFQTELTREIHRKEEEMRKIMMESQRTQEILRTQLRELAWQTKQEATIRPLILENVGSTRNLSLEINELKDQKKKLEEMLQVLNIADSQKSKDLRRLHEAHLTDWHQKEKDERVKLIRLLGELKSKDRYIYKLQQELRIVRGQFDKWKDQQHSDCQNEDEKSNGKELRRLQRQVAHWQEKMKKSEEEKREIIRRFREKTDSEATMSSSNDKTNDPSETKNMKNVKLLNEENSQLRITVDQLKQENEKLKEDGPSNKLIEEYPNDVHQLRVLICEKENTISYLQQQTKEKDRKLEQLQHRHRKEQRQNLKLMGLEPVLEYAGDEETEAVDYIWKTKNLTLLDYERLYGMLTKEHQELQRAYQVLQTNTDAMKELEDAHDRIQQLEETLRHNKDENIDEIEFSSEYQQKVDEYQERLVQLQTELQESRDQNELLEFRILELEGHHSKMLRLHSPAGTKDVWTDTENDDVSDSGIISLPASDDLSGEEGTIHEYLNQCDLKKSAENKSKLCKTDSLPCQKSPSDYYDSNTFGTTSTKSCSSPSECASFQESGIFESEFLQTYSIHTQTDESWLNQVISAPENTPSILDLNTELERLKRVQEAVEKKKKHAVVENITVFEERFQKLFDSNAKLEDEIEKYKQIATELEIQLAMYKRSGNEDTLERKLRELEDKVDHLKKENERVEEERCELEEAENDARLKYQQLEDKLALAKERTFLLQEELSTNRKLIDQFRTKMRDLRERERSAKSHSSYIETLLQNYEHRNFELEEITMELKQHLQLLQHSVPVLILWNIWTFMRRLYWVLMPDRKMLLPAEFRNVTELENVVTCVIRKNKRHDVCDSSSDQPIAKRLKKTVSDSVLTTLQLELSTLQSLYNKEKSNTVHELQSFKHEFEFCKEQLNGLKNVVSQQGGPNNEKYLQQKIESLEYDLDKYQELFAEEKNRMQAQFQKVITESNCKEINLTARLAELEGNLSIVQMELSLPETEATPQISTRKDQEFINKIRQLIHDECNLKQKIVDLEQKENAYAETIKQADDIIASVEARYQVTIVEMEETEKRQNDKIASLEENERRLQNALQLCGRSNEDDKVTKLYQRLSTLESSELTLKEALHQKEKSEKDLHLNIIQLGSDNHKLKCELIEQEELLNHIKNLEKKQNNLMLENDNLLDVQHRLELNLQSENFLQKRVEELEMIEATLKETLSQADFLINEREKKLKDQVCNLHEDVSVSQLTIEELHSQKKLLEEQKSKLKEEIVNLKQKLIDLQHEIQEQKENELQLKNNISKLRNKLSFSQKQVNDFQESNTQLCSDLTDLQGNLEEMSKAYEQTKNMQERNLLYFNFQLNDKEEENENLRLQLEHEKAMKLEQDLGILAEKEGGIFQIVQELNEGLQGAKACDVCKNSLEKLRNVYLQMQELSSIMSGVQQTDSAADSGFDDLDVLRRCESEDEINTTGSEVETSEGSTGIQVLQFEHLSLQQELEEKEEEIETMDIGQTTTPNKPSGCTGTYRERSPFQWGIATIPTPADFQIVKTIGNDALLVTWGSLPDASIIGYELFIDGKFHHKVRSGHRHRSLLHGLDLRISFIVSIQAVGQDGHASKPAAAVFTPLEEK